MAESKFGPIYAKSSADKIKTWQAIIVQENNKVMLNILHGYENGKISTNSKEIHGKNIDKANETTPWIQAEMDAQSKLNKKLDEGYVYDINELKDQVLMLPMLAHTYQKRKHDIIWPAYASPKLDGNRLVVNHLMLDRKEQEKNVENGLIISIL